MKYLLIGLLLPFTLLAEPKNLSIQDVDFETIQVGSKDTVRVKVLWQRDQWNSIANKSLLAEIRFYSGQNKGSLKRIMKSDDYYLKNRSASFDLSPSEACPSAGKYFAKIWLSIRNNDGKRSPNDGYNNYEEIYPYTCVDRSKWERVRADTEFKLADPIDRYTYKQLNLLVDVDDKQFSRVDKQGDKFEVRLYSHRDGKTYRIAKKKTYTINNASRQSFTFKISELCGELDGIWEELLGKEVEVGCRISVIDSDGSQNEKFEAYSCPSERFLCK